MNVRDILVRARALVVRGWCQYASIKLKKGTVCYCASAAISAAAEDDGLNPGWPRLRDTAQEVLRRTILKHPTVGGSIVTWNDTTGRTKNEILAKFDEAIATIPEEPREDPVVCT